MLAMPALGFQSVVVLVVILLEILDVTAEVIQPPMLTVNMTEDEKTSHLLNYLLDPNRYDKRFRPKSKGPPVNVICDFFINSFDSITETTMDYGVSVFMRQRWTDPRLSHNDSEPIFLHDITRLWTPDAFFTNEKNGHLHTVTVDNQIARIHQDGYILCSTRYSLKLACYMSLERFPMDTQVCKITMESYGYTTKDLIFDWHADKPIQTDNELKLPQFRISDILTFNCTKSYTTGSFTCIEATFTLHREVGYYILQAYLPSIILVVLSWVSFWISYEAAPARVALGVTTILTLTTLDSGIRSQLPKVSYPKAIDIWMAVCLVFVFAALVEFAGVNYISVYEKKSQKKKEDLEELDKIYAANHSRQSNEGLSMEVNGDRELIELKNRHRDELKVYQPTVELDGSVTINKPKDKSVLTADNVDKASRYVFPAVFMAFNIVYWISYQT